MEKVYDKFSFTVAYVSDGILCLQDTSRIVQVKKGSKFASPVIREKVVDDLRDYYFEDDGTNAYYRQFETIYRGCVRNIHNHNGEFVRTLQKTDGVDRMVA